MDWTTGTRRLRIGGHRGAAAIAPENTIAGFVLAADGGADYLELDVRLSQDDVAIVFHDGELGRTTDGAGCPEAVPFERLETLDAGSWFGGDFAGQRIPTLADVLAIVEARAALGATIEAKGAGTGRVIAVVARTCRASGRLSACSFDADEIRAVAALAPELPRLLILDRDEPDIDPIDAARRAHATGVNLPLDWLDEARVRELHDAGLLVAGGTVDDEQGIARAIALGVDLVDSNDPAAAVRWRDAFATTG
jgi:glycerophosphoryl diester phosphodiesterase